MAEGAKIKLWFDKENSESDVEQFLLQPLLTAEAFLGIPNQSTSYVRKLVTA